MATLLQLQSYLGRLATTLWNFGADFPVPTLDSYDDDTGATVCLR